MTKYDITHEYHPAPNLICSGTPTPEQFKTLAADGVSTVVSLKDHAEYHGRNIPQEVIDAGMDYINIPISHPQDFTPEAAQKLKEALDSASGKVLVFCGTSNRVGGLLALKCVLFDHMDIDAALEFGEKAGLTKLKPTISDILHQLNDQ